MRASIGWLLPAIIFLVLLGTWWLVVVVFRPPPYLLPAPGPVLDRIVEDRSILLENLLATSLVAMQGLFLSVIIGVGLGFLVAKSEAARILLTPTIVATQSVPKIALAPLLIVWLGLGILPKLIVVVLIVVFPIMLATIVGIRSVSQETILVARSMGAGANDLYWRVVAPSAAPFLAGAFRLASSLALIGALFAEFVGGIKGIGIQMVFAIGTHDTVLAVGALIVTALAGVVIYGLASLLARLATARVTRYPS